MTLVFLGYMYSDSQKGGFIAKSKRGYQFAAQNFQEAIIDGLIENHIDLHIVSIPPLSTYPMGSKIPYVKSTNMIYKNQDYGRCLGFLNLPFFNHPSKKQMLKTINQYLEPNGRGNLIIVYSLNSFIMRMALEIKKNNTLVKLCLIAPDLPEYMGCNKYYEMLGLRKIDIEQIYSMIPQFDSFVVLTDAMAEKMNIRQRPYMVMEGIYKSSLTAIIKKEKQKVIMYSGGLWYRYGIVDLLKAFHGIEGREYRLWLCGSGDAVDEIRQYTQKDTRIRYFGLLPTEKVKELQRSATLLANPRHSSETFTKFSFPSKTLEYMASGTPTVMCHLPCIPTEYNQFLYFFENESVEGFKKRIVEICETDARELIEFGRKASHFVLTQKNPHIQIKKMLGLIDID